MSNRAIVFAYTLSVFFSFFAHAQLRQSQVDMPQMSSGSGQELRRANESTVKSDEMLIPALKSLSIASDAANAAQLVRKDHQGIFCVGFSAQQVERLKNLLQRWMNQPVSLDSLDLMAREAEKTAAPHKESLMTAFYPRQEITEGHIVMVINVPLLTDIAIAGKPLFGADFISHAILSKPGGVADEEMIRKDLYYLNRNPFRRAAALWSPAPGDIPAANLLIHVNEKRPWSIYTGFDNYASDDLGDERFYLGGKFGNAFDLDHRLGWLFLTTADGESLHAASLNYEIPLPGHQILSFSSSISESSTSPDSSLIDNNGEFLSFRGMLETPLPDWKNLRHHWKSGFSLRDNTYSREMDEIGITIFQVENLWEGELHDRHGHTAFSTGLLWNPGEAFVSSNDSVYRELGASDSDSWVALVKADRALSFAKMGDLAITAEAQWTNENLIPSNQFAGGGVQRMRGYDEGEVFFDKALMLSAEWQFRRISISEKMNLRPLLFIDSAWLSDHDGASDYISSTGVGCQYTWQSRGSANLVFAQPLQRFQGADRDPVLYFSFNTFW